MHSLGIIHRDIKPENIFLNSNEGGYPTVKIGDFGFCINDDKDQIMSASIVGSTPYISPEIILYDPFNNTIDTWALGCILYELSEGQMLFKADTLEDIEENVQNMEIPDLNQHFTIELNDLFHKMVNRNKSERLSTGGLLMHPALSKYNEKLVLPPKLDVVETKLKHDVNEAKAKPKIRKTVKDSKIRSGSSTWPKQMREQAKSKNTIAKPVYPLRKKPEIVTKSKMQDLSGIKLENSSVFDYSVTSEKQQKVKVYKPSKLNLSATINTRVTANNTPKITPGRKRISSMSTPKILKSKTLPTKTDFADIVFKDLNTNLLLIKKSCKEERSPTFKHVKSPVRAVDKK